jgi:hypothetical protein
LEEAVIRQWVFLTEAPWLWVFPAACLLSLVLCSWAEIRKRSPLNAWLRIALLFFAHAALLLAALKPAGRQELPPKVAILLQENAAGNRLDSLQEQHPEAAVFSLRQEAAEGQTWIPHASYLQEHLSAGSTVFLLGGGLGTAELQYLEPYELYFMPAELPDGILGLSYDAKLPLSDTLKISGAGKAAGDPIWLRLSLAGRGIDSLLLSGSEVANFQLQALPELTGILEYRLDLLNHLFDTLEHYPILVELTAHKKLRLALLSGYPSFEFRHLKNWLSAEEHALYYQAEMAPGRYNREWVNMPDIKPTGLNQKLLQTVDMLVMDQQYWNKLNITAVQQIEEAVKNHGLGCLVLTESGMWRPAAKDWKSLPPIRVYSRLQEAPAWRDREGGGPLISYYRAEAEHWLPLLPNTGDAPMVVFRQQGLGRVGASLIENTYQLLLQDQQPAYQRLWTEILNALVKAESSTPIIKAEFPAFVTNRHQLEFWQPQGEMPEVVFTDPDGGEQLLPLMEDIQISGLWHAYFWPSQPGPHRIKMQGGDSLSLMVYPETRFTSLRQFQDTKETFKFAEKRQVSPSFEYERGEGRFRYKAVSLLWFYGLFLLSMSGLWIEHKLSSL